MSPLEVIIPAYNEEHRIRPTLLAYLHFFKNRNVQFTIVLNGCTDQTRQVVAEVQKQWPDRLEIKEIKEAVGKGGAILKGWKESSSDLVAFVDADGATPPKEFEKLLKELDSHDGVIASRFIRGAHARRSGMRLGLSFGFRSLVRLLFHLPFQDTQCGAKVFRRTAIQSFLSAIRITNMAFDVNLLAECVRKRLKIKEVPTDWVEQPHSEMFRSVGRQVRVGWKMFLSLVDLKIFYLWS